MPQLSPFNGSLYQDYLVDQSSHPLSGACDHLYLDFLKTELLPNFSYSEANVLDVGCNKFLSYDYFLKNFDNKILGIDISVDGLKAARDRKANAFELDAHKIKDFFAPESFDLLISFHSFEHMFDLPLVIEGCSKILKSGGYLYCSFPIPSYNWKKKHWFDIPNKETFLSMTNQYGLKEVFGKVYFCQFRPEQELVCLLKKSND